jgi:hypothetical protein
MGITVTKGGAVIIACPKRTNRGGGMPKGRKKKPEELRRVEVACEYCQETFEKIPSQVKPRNFCCFEHYNLSRTK